MVQHRLLSHSSYNFPLNVLNTSFKFPTAHLFRSPNVKIKDSYKIYSTVARGGAMGNLYTFYTQNFNSNKALNLKLSNWSPQAKFLATPSLHLLNVFYQQVSLVLNDK